MARSLWSGSIAFGLVNVPVRLATAIREKSVHFNMLTPDGQCRLRRKLYCPETGKEYDFKDTARGYEVAPGQYVIIDEDELDAIKPEAGRTIDLQQFVELEEVEPLYFDRPYLLVPGDGGEEGYQLLVKAMTDTGRIGIATFVMRQKQHLAALRVVEIGKKQHALILQTMHYADEVAVLADPPSELPDKDKAPPAKQVQVAKQLLDAMSEPFDPSKFHDDYRERVEKLIEDKQKGKEVVDVSTDEEEAPPTFNLMEALKQSVERKKSGKKKTKAG